jgi:MOSC domain-containing protein YiiM
VIRSIHVAPEAEAPTVSVPEVMAVAERGLEGDRYFFERGTFSRWPGTGRNVTLIEQEVIEAVRREFGIDLGDGRSRRNIVTSNVALSGLNGRQFRIGAAVMRGTRECAPCRHLERLLGPGVYNAMLGRGGLRAEILTGGVIRVGDAIEPL